MNDRKSHMQIYVQKKISVYTQRKSLWKSRKSIMQIKLIFLLFVFVLFIADTILEKNDFV